MRKDRIFCVKCGKETESLIDGLCMDCYSKKGGFLGIKRKRIIIDVCSSCGVFKYKGRWLKGELEEAMKMAVVDNLIPSENISWKEPMISFNRKGRTLYEVTIDLEGKIGGSSIRERVNAEILINKLNCPTCSKKAGKYYEAIIQIRDIERDEIGGIEDFLRKKIDEMGDEGRGVFITDMRMTEKGLDIYMSDKKVAHSLIYKLKNEFGGEVKESPKLFGIKDGIRQYRMTYLLRIPKYREGDIIIKDGRLFYIFRYSANGIKVIDLRNWKERDFRHREISSCKVLEKGTFIKEAVVVSRRGREIQILDPDNYKTLDVILPEDLKIGETVRIVKHKEEIFVIPRD